MTKSDVTPSINSYANPFPLYIPFPQQNAPLILYININITNYYRQVEETADEFMFIMAECSNKHLV